MVTNTISKKIVRIRTQTNGLPNHCYSAPDTKPSVILQIDFESNWMPSVAKNKNAQADNKCDLD